MVSCTGYKVSILQVTVIPGITGDGLHGMTDDRLHILQFSGITSEVLHGLLTCNTSPVIPENCNTCNPS